MSIDALRQKINNLDEQLLELLTVRVSFALEVLALKRQNEGDEMPVYVPAREKEILMRLAAKNTSALSASAVEHIFQVIIEECRNLQHERLADAGDPITISVQGQPGSFSEQAAEAYVKRRNLNDVHIHHGIGSLGVLEDLLAKKADLGLMAINNTWGGLVGETVAALTDSRYEVVDTIAITISQNLMVLPGFESASIKHIYSHPQALKQCRDYLKANYPDAEQHETNDTAQAAADLQAGSLNEHSAVIGSKRCMSAYGLDLVAGDIHDIAYNETLFFVVKSLDQ